MAVYLLRAALDGGMLAGHVECRRLAFEFGGMLQSAVEDTQDEQMELSTCWSYG